MVAGLVRPDEGHIIVSGRRLFDSNRSVDLPPEKRRVGYIFQEGRLFPHLSVRSNLTYGMRLTPKAERYVEFDQVVAPARYRTPGRPPAGETLGRGKTAGGDRSGTAHESFCPAHGRTSCFTRFARKAEVLPFIARLSGEFSIPILYVSHSLEEILNLADVMVVLDSGRAVASGRIEELMSRRDLQQFNRIHRLRRRNIDRCGITP